MNPILDFLARLDWSDRRGAHGQAAGRFEALQPAEVLADIKQGLPAPIDVSRSVEKTTHYKWFLAAAPDSSFEVWLHEYKPSELRRTGHATVPHNHRFWLTSLILRGGFEDTRYVRAEEGSIEPSEHRSLRPGNTMVVDPEEIHALSGLRDSTISMVVQSKPVRSYSEVFENGEVRRYSDLEAKLAELRESL
ncbi:MAG TPA: hypothetical protein VGV69_05670 [Solirubrobacterales bacterium]|nr:hypothetical protein [Solirubrobacterales bacterium]